MSLKEYEVSVSEEVYRKIWDFINELKEKSYTDNIRLKILAEYIQLLKEGS